MFLRTYFVSHFSLVIYCFNLDINNPIIYEDPLKYSSSDSSYFGYSSILYPGSSHSPPWIQVGAPKANNSKMWAENSGAVFRCEIGRHCLLLNTEIDNEIHVENFKYTVKVVIDKAFIGGAMDVNYETGRFVVCGHRLTFATDYLTKGGCFWAHVDDNKTQTLLPLLDKPNFIGKTYFYGHACSGFSVHMPTKTNSKIVMGAPGTLGWKGTTLVLEDNSNTAFGELSIADTRGAMPFGSEDYFGYAVTSGYFFGDKKLLYVSSAPRAGNKRGQVLIYETSFLNQIDIKDIKQGEQFGEYFGASLASGDLNNDGYDDLLVGSPYFVTNYINEGQVHVYLGGPGKSLTTPDQNPILKGQVVRGQFGSCIQYLGDLDHDNNGDFAIASPYEDSGVVYIYLGSNSGLHLGQKIIGSEIYPTLKGFGLSISRSVDVDHNSYPDVVIGAPLSGHAVVLKSRPPVVIYHTLRPLTRVDYNKKEFKVEACYWFIINEKTRSNKIRSITISRTLTIDEELGRAFLKRPTVNLTIRDYERSCEKITIGLTETTNFKDPIILTLSHKFLENDNKKNILYIGTDIEGEGDFCNTCPIYDKIRSTGPTQIEVGYFLGCGDDNICHANLQIEARFSDLEDDTFIVGSKDYLQLNVSLKNLREKAYLTRLQVEVPDSITFSFIPPQCGKSNKSSISCSMGNMLEENTSSKPISVDLDMGNINNGYYGEGVQHIRLTASTDSENEGEKNLDYSFRLKREADVTISGQSTEQIYSYSQTSSRQSNFTQIYEIKKVGTSLIEELTVQIQIPHAILGQNFLKLLSFKGQLDEEPINCKTSFNRNDNSIFNLDFKRTEMDNVSENLPSNRTLIHINCTMENVNCSVIKCNVGPFRRGTKAAVLKIKMLFDSTSLEDVIEGSKDVVVISTFGYVTVSNPLNFNQSGSLPDIAAVSSLFIGESPEQRIAVWIIIVAAVLGLLILALLIFALIKIGFFRRSIKEELEHIKGQEQAEFDDIIEEDAKTINTDLDD